MRQNLQTNTKNIQVGDIVELQSGSAKMTVSGIKQDLIFCTWYCKNDLKIYEKILNKGAIKLSKIK